MDLLKSELARNVTGYFLVVLGMAAVWAGSHWHFEKMIDLGASLVTASLVAFQAKRTPDVPPPPSVQEPAASPKA